MSPFLVFVGVSSAPSSACFSVLPLSGESAGQPWRRGGGFRFARHARMVGRDAVSEKIHAVQEKIHAVSEKIHAVSEKFPALKKFFQALKKFFQVLEFYFQVLEIFFQALEIR
ncbi:MAG: hypothetical protein U0L68_07605 [Prevotellamassilia sp.]|nr:hypothetical protein [Prevotellamassilia sp.]